MLNGSANLEMSTSVLKSLPGKLDIKIHSPSILYLYANFDMKTWFLLLLVWLHKWIICNPVPEVV